MTIPIPEGLTFDDVLLVPRLSDLVPTEVDVSTRFTRRVSLHSPIASAAMDTVTEWRLAVALAREGGIGIIHRNLSIQGQIAEVDKVKRSANGIIKDPVTLPPTATMGEAREIMRKHNISGLQIIDGAGNVIGILTNRDCRFETEACTKVSDVITKDHLVCAPPGISLN